MMQFQAPDQNLQSVKTSFEINELFTTLIQYDVIPTVVENRYNRDSSVREDVG